MQSRCCGPYFASLVEPVVPDWLLVGAFYPPNDRSALRAPRPLIAWRAQFLPSASGAVAVINLGCICCFVNIVGGVNRFDDARQDIHLTGAEARAWRSARDGGLQFGGGVHKEAWASRGRGHAFIVTSLSKTVARLAPRVRFSAVRALRAVLAGGSGL